MTMNSNFLNCVNILGGNFVDHTVFIAPKGNLFPNMCSAIDFSIDEKQCVIWFAGDPVYNYFITSDTMHCYRIFRHHLMWTRKVLEGFARVTITV